METNSPSPESAADFVDRFSKKAARDRIPVSGTIDLTYRCNLSCAHCYLGHGAERTAGRGPELVTAQWRSLIDAMVRDGCLFLLISGGEPLLRPDFAEIYSHARKSGLVVTVFTNGTRFDDDVLDLFSQWPPQQIEISLYGASPATYARTTGHPEAYEAVMRGIDRLRGCGLRFDLKTVLTRDTRPDFEKMAATARRFGVHFRFDPALFCDFHGGRTPIDLRIDPEAAVALELADPERVDKAVDYYRRMKDAPAIDQLYLCGAGLTNFYIDPFGRMKPCLLVDDPAADLKKTPFGEAWKKTIANIRTRTARPDFVCKTCDKRVVCGVCPAFFRLENRDEQTPAPYLCALGHYRLEAIRKAL